MDWIMKHPRARLYHLGFIPSFLSEQDPRPAREQFEANYVSGWQPMPGFKMQLGGSLSYPGDPDLPLLAKTRLRDETIFVYQYAWVCIKQPDGAFEVARLD